MFEARGTHGTWIQAELRTIDRAFEGVDLLYLLTPRPSPNYSQLARFELSRFEPSGFAESFEASSTAASLRGFSSLFEVWGFEEERRASIFDLLVLRRGSKS